MAEYWKVLGTIHAINGTYLLRYSMDGFGDELHNDIESALMIHGLEMFNSYGVGLFDIDDGGRPRVMEVLSSEGVLPAQRPSVMH
jgi:hypothetical protein